ncbi:DNA-binding protein [Candidatus Methylospira mobilis]|uniref:DNA-binding protein n=1 Tax=Candidatus Methylospira mobilis TaxID=1808979 RepID=A0A5Q0BEB4_9GAMM|nr:DNA-binding protein [Candidatus Methylospira mobilis]QFY42213.1 DNA-binding protein [Candidatus Methylospira mobilis]WNV03230.1 DNA-binding protein [Candidatus Methylospira mobilis]
MNTTEDKLAKQYGGLLLDTRQVAEVLHRTPEGLRFTLRGESAFAEKLKQGRLKIGRRILFRVDVVAAVIDGGV